jgi:hypothetical protein
MPDTAQIFANILDLVKTLDPANTRKWFDDLVVLRFAHGLLEIGCPDEATAQFLYDNCPRTFNKAAQNATGHLVTVKFSPIQTRFAPSTTPRPQWAVKVHPDYTFENFVVGPANRLAHASCIAVSHAPGTTYNPLFLYGSVGLGKTHLLHAACHETQKKFADASVRFLSCEQFVNAFISAIEKGTLQEFQSHCRSVDMLVIDDVQFLSEREHSQEEFFHTFNALYNNRKQIVLTADCAPLNCPRLRNASSADSSGASSQDSMRPATKQESQSYRKRLTSAALKSPNQLPSISPTRSRPTSASLRAPSLSSTPPPRPQARKSHLTSLSAPSAPKLTSLRPLPSLRLSTPLPIITMSG